MNRRSLFKVIGGLLAGSAASTVMVAPRKYGVLTVEGHNWHKHVTGEDLHVYVDGVDVTANCHRADDVEGYALVFCRDEVSHRDLTAKGYRHTDDGGHSVCQFRLTGRVVISAGSPL